MAQVLIRKLDDGLLADYRSVAKRNGTSLEAELRQGLARARPSEHLSGDELVELSLRLRAVTPPSAAALDSTDLIREDRDSRLMIVVDASVVVKVVTEEAGSDQAMHRLRRETQRTAPDWLRAEIASALSKKVRYGGLPVEQAGAALAAVGSIMPRLAPSEPFLTSAMTLSVQLRHALYDCLYLALALREGCALLTADGKFHAIAAQSPYADRVELLA